MFQFKSIFNLAECKARSEAVPFVKPLLSIVLSSVVLLLATTAQAAGDNSANNEGWIYLGGVKNGWESEAYYRLRQDNKYTTRKSGDNRVGVRVDLKYEPANPKKVDWKYGIDDAEISCVLPASLSHGGKDYLKDGSTESLPARETWRSILPGTPAERVHDIFCPDLMNDPSRKLNIPNRWVDLGDRVSYDPRRVYGVSNWQSFSGEKDPEIVLALNNQRPREVWARYVHAPNYKYNRKEYYILIHDSCETNKDRTWKDNRNGAYRGWDLQFSRHHDGLIVFDLEDDGPGALALLGSVVTGNELSDKSSLATNMSAEAGTVRRTLAKNGVICVR